MMADIICVLVIVLLLGVAIAYIVRQKRAGVKCIGCSVGQECAKRAQAAQAEQPGAGCGCGCGGCTGATTCATAEQAGADAVRPGK